MKALLEQMQAIDRWSGAAVLAESMLSGPPVCRCHDGGRRLARERI